MDIEIEQKDNKRQPLENKIILLDCKVIEETNRLGINKISSKTNGDRFMDSIIIPPKNHNYNKNKKQKSKIFNEKFCFDKDLFIETTSY